MYPENPSLSPASAYDITAGLNIRKDLDKWSIVDPFLAYVFACLELSWGEIVTCQDRISFWQHLCA